MTEPFCDLFMKLLILSNVVMGHGSKWKNLKKQPIIVTVSKESLAPNTFSIYMATSNWLPFKLSHSNFWSEMPSAFEWISH